MWIAIDKNVKTWDGRKVYAVRFGKKFEIRITLGEKKSLCPKMKWNKHMGHFTIYFLTKAFTFDYRRHIEYVAC